MASRDEIAIVGIGCNFPGGEGVDNFWKVLENARNCTVEIPPESLNVQEWHDLDGSKPGKIGTMHAALLDEFNSFDNNLFGIDDEEAKQMDPQQKLLLECTFRALEDAGVTPENIGGTKTGVFVGLMNRDHESVISRGAAEINHHSSTGAAMSMAANRISFVFNLTGPSVAIDTACSSSLVALHLGYKAITQGDCESALCGGVNCITEPWKFVSLSKAKLVAPEGISKPFSRTADGYGRGEGCGIVYLKPLKKAQEDFNRIWGVISISTVNQNGRSVTPITRPSQQEQEKLLLSVYPTHVDPSVVQYVEAHGTGTPAGDSMEAESLGNVIGKRRPPNMPPLKIGSVKGNIGHTESAAGAASLIKVLLMMHHGKIVPTLHISEGNSSINAKELNLSIPTRVEDWEDSSEFGRVAGINSFGFGGTNAHVVVRQIKSNGVLPPVKRPAEIFAISAASGKSLQLAMEDTSRYLSTGDTATLPSLAYTSACRRSHFSYKHRKAFVVSSLQQLQQQLLSAAGKETAPSRKAPQLIFVFSGEDPDFKGICRNLLKSEPVFRDKCIEVKQLFQQLSPTGILDLTENECKDLSSPDNTQPLLFTLQVALVALLQHWGIKPIAALGHSMGEVAAAHCAGLLSLEDAVKVIYHRSRLQAKVLGGKMLVVGNLPIPEVSTVLAAYSGKVCIAAFNSPVSCTLSGDPDSIEALQKDLAERFGQRNVFLQPLNVPAAYHSHMMDPVLTEMSVSLSELKEGKAVMDLISTTTGKAVSGGDFVTGSYWARQARDPVSFADAIMTLSREKDNFAIIEIGPQKTLHRYIIETLGMQCSVFSSLQIDKEYVALLNLVKDIFELGLNIDWQHFYEGYQSMPSAYPRYQFDHSKVEPYLNINKQLNSRGNYLGHPLICSISRGNSEFTCSISEALTPYLCEPKNQSTALILSAFLIELSWASMMANSKPKVPLQFCQMKITFSTPHILNENPHVLKIKVDSHESVSNIRILSLSSNTLYASGQVTKNRALPIEEKSISLKHIFERCSSVASEHEVYETLAGFGFPNHAPYGQLNSVLYSDVLKEAVTTVHLKGKVAEEMHEYHIHPLVLDYFFQILSILVKATSESKEILLSGINSIVLAQPFEEEMTIYLKMVNSTNHSLEFSGCFTNKHGVVLAELKCVQISFRKDDSRKENDVLFNNKWKEILSHHTMQNLPKAPRVVVFADKFGIAQQLRNYLHSESRFVTYQEWDKLLGTKKPDISAQCKINLELQGYQDVLFMWGIQKLNENVPEKVVKYSVRCCEAFRQVVASLKERRSQCSITVITYRTSEKKVDHINTGFGLYGMVRTCMVEVPEITFQIIDIGSTNPIDISALADVLVKYKAQDYPEVWIDEGRIHSSEIKRTQMEPTMLSRASHLLKDSELCILHTGNPYDVDELSVKVASPLPQLDNHSVEVQIEKISLHSEDYFPVSVSSWKFGKIIYWNSDTTNKHQLLALDFSGTVTAAGSEVKKLKVGDHIVSCYPVSAASRIQIPETVCFNTQKFPCFRNLPFMSFFLIAKEVLHRKLPVPKHSEILGIISTQPESVLCKVLNFAAQELGWKTILSNHATGLWQRVNQCNALIFLSPLTKVLKESLVCLFHLRDIVLIYGNELPECLQDLTGIDKENIHIHTVNITHIFQKASLIRSQKEVYCWLKLMNMKLLNLPYSIFKQAGMGKSLDITASYFNCKSVPVAVLKSDDEDKVSDILVMEEDRRLFKQNAVYIITGGLTGLGLETVKFVVQNGGRRLVIFSKGAPNAEMEMEIKSLQDHCEGGRIVALQCNVIHSSEVEKAVKSVSKMFPNYPVKGVFHCASAVHDGNMETLSLCNLEEAFSPKIVGAINLHRATHGQELDHFVCYSSLSSFLGSAPQANFAAANSFLDLFCHYRRNSGLPGQSINWGTINLGAQQQAQSLDHIHTNMFQIKGVEDLQMSNFHEYLKMCLLLNSPQQAVVKFNFQALANHVLSQNLPLRSRFHALVSEEMGWSAGCPVEAKPWNPSLDRPVDYVISLVRSLFDTAPKNLSMQTPLPSLGVDSMVALTLQNRIFLERKVEVPLVTLLDPHTTISTLILLLKENHDTLDDSHEAVGNAAGSWL